MVPLFRGHRLASPTHILTGVTCAPHHLVPTEWHWEPWEPITSPPLPLSLCVRVTNGTFFHHYSNDVLLHCGLSDSVGRVYNFDERGLNIAEHWVEAVCVPLQSFAPPFTDGAHWDACLSHWCTHFAPRGQAYHPFEYNCTDFVTEALTSITAGDHWFTKEAIASILKPYIAECAQYTDIARSMHTFGDDFVPSAIYMDEAFAFMKSTAPYECNGCHQVFYGDHARWRCASCDTDFCEDCFEFLLHMDTLA